MYLERQPVTPQRERARMIIFLLYSIFMSCIDYIIQAGKGEAQWLGHLNEGK